MIRCKIHLEDIGNTCPLCNEQALDASFDDHRDGYYEDTFKCENCGVMVTYITKSGDPRQYHEYRDGEIEVQFEWPFGHSNPEDDMALPGMEMPGSGGDEKPTDAPPDLPELPA